jgi:hypothetical protein
MKLEFYPDFDLKVVDIDNNIETKVFDDGVLVTFAGEKNGVFFPYESDTNSIPYPMVGELEDEAIPLVRYIVEKYNLLTCAIDDFFDAASHCARFIWLCENPDILDAVIDDYATHEMLAFANKYGWSDEFIVHLKAVRKAAREELGVKDSYVVGDIVKFDLCGEELIHSQYGKVIYVDKQHTIVHVTAYTMQLMDLNRNYIPHDVVSGIICQDIGAIIEHDYDKFIDMMDPNSYLAVDPFSPDTWITPNTITFNEL